ncbi:thioredoxin domain-containing protein [Mangrovicoccus ximenensis]|uniref:hypothetical protein n=1 Tax=Mangrovicoccus ximenensis TaxID=1911570 RepID=UPI000D33943F|nr:hypothetical protein [Mangrovicoccus ximenensis]
MANITFFEKPGCISNARQKRLLENSGHQLPIANLLAQPWTPATLRPFFGAMPVAAWFNAAAPAIRSGRVRPEALDQVGGSRRAGFDPAEIHAWTGLADPGSKISDACPTPAART